MQAEGKYIDQNALYLMLGSSSKYYFNFTTRANTSTVPLEGVLPDLKKFTDRFKAGKYDFIQTSAHNNQKTTYTVQAILQWFKNNLLKRDFNTVYFFYSGHGNKNGNFLVDTQNKLEGEQIDLDQFVKVFKDFLDQKKDNKKDYKLLIFLDSCYSGQLCYRLPQILESSKTNIDIGIFAASGRRQQIKDKQTGGLFYHCLLGNETQFQEAYPILAEYNPTFINKSKKPAPITKQMLKKLNQNIHAAKQFISEEIQGIIVNKISQEQCNIVYPDSSHYKGQFKIINGDYIRDGHGIYKTATGEKYEGQWKDGLMEGMGLYILLNGFKFVGEWEKGKIKKGDLKFQFSQDSQNNINQKIVYP